VGGRSAKREAVSMPTEPGPRRCLGRRGEYDEIGRPFQTIKKKKGGVWTPVTFKEHILKYQSSTPRPSLVDGCG